MYTTTDATERGLCGQPVLFPFITFRYLLIFLVALIFKGQLLEVLGSFENEAVCCQRRQIYILSESTTRVCMGILDADQYTSDS